MTREKNGTGFDLSVTFTHPETKESEDVYIDIPFDIFVEALRQYNDIFNDVILDGKDIDVWNLFAQIDGALDYFGFNVDFLKICAKLYKDTSYEYDDFEEWKDMYDYDHEIGEYSEEDSDEEEE